MSTATLEYKASNSAPDGRLLGADDNTGVVEAIVSVTGVRDHDDDIIEPGAYAKTLTHRRPKGIFSHDWGRWVARTEAIEEWMPGDPRLPQTTKDGAPWPDGAGGLYVKARFNLATDEGRNGYHNVKFFAETGECEWSVGYRVPSGKSTKDKAGVRRIKEMDLFEYSPVLFGANSMSSTLAVKSAAPSEYAEPEPDAFVADGEPWTELEEEANAVTDDDIPKLADVEQQPESEQGEDADEEAAEEDQAAQAEDEDEASASDGEEKGSSASLNRSPKKNWVEKSGELPAYVREIARSVSQKRDVPLERAIPIAIATVKRWARGGGDVSAETKAKAAKAVAEWEKLKAANASRSKGDDAETDVKTAEQPSPGETVESTLFPHLPGTYEELREQIRQEAVKRFANAVHVEMMGTWPGCAVVNVYAEHGVSKAFEVPYSVTVGDNTTPATVTLDEPEPVELLVAVDGVEESGESMLPFPSMIEDAVSGLKAWLTHAPESKAGRVLSATNERRLLGAVESLVAVLKAAGLEIDAKPKQADEDEEERSNATDMVTAADSTAPSARPEGKVVDPGLLARGYRVAADAAARRL